MKPAAIVLMLAAAIGWGGAAWAQTLSAATLQRLLQAQPKHELRFTELRESPWLNAPIESSGSLIMSATALEKRIEKPHRETWRILADRMQLLADDSTVIKEFVFRDAPAIAVLANALRDAMAGNLVALEADFQTDIAGDENAWTVRLTPRRPEVARVLKQLELQGSKGRLQVFVVQETQGERTTTRLVRD